MSRLTTRGVRLMAPGVLDLVEVPLGEPGPGEAVVSITSVGLCGSDAHWFEEGTIGDADLGAGLIPGHEASGVITTGPRAGERVALEPAIPCLTCEICAEGRPHLCPSVLFAGHNTDGALRAEMIWPERALVRLPDRITTEQGALLEPLGIALHALDMAGDRAIASCAVLGAGPIGLLLIAILKRRGAGPILVTDLHPHRLEAARQFGATEVLQAKEDGSEHESVLSASGSGVDVSFETSGADSALHSALLAARPGGRVVLVGIPPGDHTGFVASLARRKELTLATSRRMLPSDLARAAELADTGTMPLDRLITHRYPLAKADEAFATLVRREGLKVVIQPSPPSG